jgi:hypothetical protein
MQSQQQSPNRTSLAYILVVVGILLFIGQNFQVNVSQYMWPFTIIIPGLALLAGMVIFGRSAAGLAIPGTIVTAVGTLLLFQNTVNYFESWAYAWALIAPGSVGLGIWLKGLWGSDPRAQRVGMGLAFLGVVLFGLFFVMFEGFLGLSPDLFSRYLLPAALIIVAFYMLSGRREKPRL